MAIFIQTDDDDAMLAALEIVRDTEVAVTAADVQEFEQRVTSMFPVIDSEGVKDAMGDVFDRMDRGVPAVPGITDAEIEHKAHAAWDKYDADVAQKAAQFKQVNDMRTFAGAVDLMAHVPKEDPESVLARVNAATEDLGSDALVDFVVAEVDIKPRNAVHLGPVSRCDVYNAVNKFNGGINVETTTRVDTMETIARQGLSASTLLFTALGYPLED